MQKAIKIVQNNNVISYDESSYVVPVVTTPKVVITPTSTKPPLFNARVFDKGSKSIKMPVSEYALGNNSGVTKTASYQDNTYPDISNVGYYPKEEQINNVEIQEGESVAVISSADLSIDEIWVNNQGELVVKSDKASQYSIDDNGSLIFNR
jgi:hypothetical protein